MSHHSQSYKELLEKYESMTMELSLASALNRLLCKRLGCEPMDFSSIGHPQVTPDSLDKLKVRPTTRRKEGYNVQ